MFLAGFVLISSLALATWLKTWNQHQSLAAFRELAANNAAFVEQMRLPRSPELAKRLARILDMGVGFKFDNGQSGEWPKSLEPIIEELTAQNQAVAKLVDDYEIATAPIVDSDTDLILIRPLAEDGKQFSSGVLIPALGLAIVCGGLGLILAKTVVSPLGSLTNWLPNLDIEPHAEKNPISPAILNRRDEIGALARALDQTTDRLQKEQQLRQQSARLATLGRIATSLAHEIKNPAAAIGMHADLLDQNAKPEQKESVGLIKEEVERITDLVNQWLFVAKARPGSRSVQDLGVLLNNVHRRLSPAFAHANVRLHLNIEQNLQIEADGARMEQVIRNLLLNAAQAMPKGGDIKVTLSTKGQTGILQVADQGPGFSKEALSRFGEPFFSEKEGGMGIGLTLAKDVVEAHGGKIHPENLKDGGAVVICELPLANSEES